jgi:hypothetical protein
MRKMIKQQQHRLRSNGSKIMSSSLEVVSSTAELVQIPLERVPLHERQVTFEFDEQELHPSPASKEHIIQVPFTRALAEVQLRQVLFAPPLQVRQIEEQEEAV